MKRTELLLSLATLLCAFSILSCAGSSPTEKAAAPPADPGQTVATTQAPIAAATEPTAVVHASEAAAGQEAKAKGKAVFEQCAICHNIDSDEDKMGPSLKGLFHKQKMKNGRPVNEETVRAVIKSGGNGMPGYEDLLSAEEMDNLIAYLKTI